MGREIPFKLTWVLFTQDILPEAGYDTTLANFIWQEECYIPVVYNVDGALYTQAEAYVIWGKRGYSRDTCEQIWNLKGFELSAEENRAPTQEYKRRRRIEMLRDTSAGTG